ncbi:DUF6221 family protein [Micromonospora sp. NPDC047730]|uniref:DUF6221 family protein n=1 Tax=Micromonospora sp. NPDC047730 TaxID=3364253 RepID=UPI003711E5B1
MSGHEAEIAALLAFVEKRLDEVELVARMADAGRVWRNGSDIEAGHFEPETVIAMNHAGQPGWLVAEAYAGDVARSAGAVAAHIARHSPYRTLREVAAVRHLLARWRKEIRRRDANAELLSALVALPQEKPYDHTMIEQTRAEAWMLRGRIWALTYALMLEGRKHEDHPDWRPRWCPERLFPPAYTCPCHPPLIEEN